MPVVVDIALLRTIAGGSRDERNVRAVVAGLERFGQPAGLERPHRFAHYLAQLAHESGRFRHDEEIWGPTPAQRRYEDRADLGHRPAVPGEAFLPRARRHPADGPGEPQARLRSQGRTGLEAGELNELIGAEEETSHLRRM